MAAGYSSIMYRLGGVLPSGGPSPAEDTEVLKDALSSYFLGDSLDSVSRELSWLNFSIPRLLTVAYDFLSSDAHRIRLNDYLFRYLDQAILHGGIPGICVDSEAVSSNSSADELEHAREERVFGAISLFVDAGSETVFLNDDYISSFMYELFPGLEEFLRMVNPTSLPFISGNLSLESLSEYMISIQVCDISYAIF